MISARRGTAGSLASIALVLALSAIMFPVRAHLTAATRAFALVASRRRLDDSA